MSGWTSGLIGRSYLRGSALAGSCNSQIRLLDLDPHPTGDIENCTHPLTGPRAERRLYSSRTVPDAPSGGFEKPPLQGARDCGERGPIELHRIVCSSHEVRVETIGQFLQGLRVHSKVFGRSCHRPDRAVAPSLFDGRDELPPDYRSLEALVVVGRVVEVGQPGVVAIRACLWAPYLDQRTDPAPLDRGDAREPRGPRPVHQAGERRLYPVVEGMPGCDSARTCLTRNQLKESVAELARPRMKVRPGEIGCSHDVDLEPRLGCGRSDLPRHLIRALLEAVIDVGHLDVELQAVGKPPQHVQKTGRIRTSGDGNENTVPRFEHPVAVDRRECGLHHVVAGTAEPARQGAHESPR